MRWVMGVGEGEEWIKMTYMPCLSHEIKALLS